MKGIRARIIAERTLRFEPYEWPEPRKEEILVRLERTIVSAGTELANYTGLDPDTRRPGGWCYYPWSPGYGGIGRVVAVGPDVKAYKAGDRVYGIFNHATYGLLDTRARFALPVPEGLDPDEAIFARMAGVSITALHRATVALGDTALVIGLGLVGNLCGQFFALNGQNVIGLDPVESRRKLAESCGFAATLAPSEDLPERIAELSHKRGARVVVDAVGQSPLVIQAVELAAKWGQVILLGTPRADHTMNATPVLADVHRRGVDLIGAHEWLYPVLKRSDLGNALTIEGNAERILEQIAAGRLKVKPLLSHKIHPLELDEAYRGLLDRKEEYLGVVLDWTQLAED
ncbi:MAG: zinc-binding alcohol dehydrogenase [Armatimonadetes bacterium]|nr:zinc-binding alcohol dehydrogenase [Armatimonadota bacterium]